MAVHYLHWCPNGCGKKVIYYDTHIKYKCKYCNKTFNKEQIKRYEHDEI